MPAPANLTHESTTGTGTGNLTLVSNSGKQTFNDAFGTGGSDVFDYFISHQAADEWEVGTGSLSDATTLVRDTVINSSNSDAAVTFSAGTKDVTNDVPATIIGTTDTTQTFTNKTLTSPVITTPALGADSVDAITEIAAALKTGADTTLATGTAGTSGNLSQWNADGDLVDASAAVSDVDPRGQHQFNVRASEMTPESGAAPDAFAEQASTNKQMWRGWTFGAAAYESAHFPVEMPPSYNGGTLVMRPIWLTQGTNGGNVEWDFEGVSFGDSDPHDAAFGTLVTSTDAGSGTDNDIMIGPEVTMTVSAAAAEELAFIRVSRDGTSDSGSDDAVLLQVRGHYTINAANDD